VVVVCGTAQPFVVTAASACPPPQGMAAQGLRGELDGEDAWLRGDFVP
jgi:hypothetical protein